jgi:hypothetical protein
VTFKSQFSASQVKAHNRIIATKIHEELTKLRAGVDASPTTPRRWVWELIQNAKDVNIGGKVRVRIKADLDDVRRARHLRAQRGRVLGGKHSIPDRAGLVEGPDE